MTPGTVLSSENNFPFPMGSAVDKQGRPTRFRRVRQLSGSLQYLTNLKSILDSDPTNIEAANRYWDALGSVSGDTTTAHAAVFPADGRVITPDVLDKFTVSVRNFAVAVATQPISSMTEKFVYQQLEANKLLFDHCWSGAMKVT